MSLPFSSYMGVSVNVVTHLRVDLFGQIEAVLFGEPVGDLLLELLPLFLRVVLAVDGVSAG